MPPAPTGGVEPCRSSSSPWCCTSSIRGLSRARNRVDGAQLVGWVPDTNWRVVAPLARTDLRLVLRHPAFVVGALVTPLLMLFAAPSESVSSWRQVSAGIALGLVPLGWLTIIAVNLVTLRPRRTGTEELFAALPAPQPVRTTAMLSAAIGPVIAAAILAATWVLVMGSREELRGSPRWAEIAAGVLIVAGSVCVGVAVARWLPNPGFGVLAVVVTIVIQERFLDVTTWPWSRSEGDPLRFLGFLARPTSVTDDFLELRPSGWHLMYLAGLVAVMAGVALAREGVRRPVAIVVGTGVLVAATAGWMQTRPLSAAQEDAMASYLVQPGDHQICENLSRSTLLRIPELRGRRGRLAGPRPPDAGDVAGGGSHRPPTARGHSTPGDHRQQRRLLTQAVRGRLASRRRRPGVSGRSVAGRRSRPSTVRR